MSGESGSPFTPCTLSGSEEVFDSDISIGEVEARPLLCGRISRIYGDENLERNLGSEVVYRLLDPNFEELPISRNGIISTMAASEGALPVKVAKPSQDVISQSIGDFGRWQLLLTFLLSLFNFPCTFHIFAPTFEGATPKEFWCARPANLRDLPVHLWKNISGTTTVTPEGAVVYDPCRIKDLNYTAYTFNYADHSSVAIRPCTHWEYDTSSFGDTIVTEWDLVCENSQLGNIAEMMFLMGVAIGGLASGLLSDRLGRKKTLMTSLLLQIVLGTAVALTPRFWLYCLIRCVLGFVCVSVVFSGFVLCMELVGGKWLTISGVSYLFPLPLSYIAISGIAYYIHGWRKLQLAITLPAVMFLALWWILPESPRWLLTMGKVDQVMEVLEEAARVNGIKLPSNTDKLLKQSVSKVTSDEAPPKVGLADLFRTPTIRKISLVLYIVWFSVYLVYYGLVLNLSNIGGDVYINSVIAGAVELPAIAVSILFLLYMGRKWPLSLTMIGAGIACLLTIPAPKDEMRWVTITLAMIGKFCISSSNVVMPVFTAELFPTVMRNLGVGSSNVPAGIALMIVPYLWNLAGMHVNLPMQVLGVVGIAGGACVLLLPETGHGLADTLQDLEASKEDAVKGGAVKGGAIKGGAA